MLEKVSDMPASVNNDIHSFIDSLEQEPFDQNLLKEYGLKNDDIVGVLKFITGVKGSSKCAVTVHTKVRFSVS